MTKFKIAACVILYNPEADVVENVKSYAPFVDKLFVVNNQNGDEVISKLQNLFEYIEVITYPENMGIALPLNDVLAKAKGNFDFLLTMDQDSCFSDGSIPKYFSEIESFNWKETLGVSPAIITADAITPPVFRICSLEEDT